MKKFVLKSIEFYQKRISPTTPPRCRYIPTCSAYTYEAVERFGVFKGLYLGLRRFLRCNPLHKGGYDPVPKTFSFLSNKNKSKKCLDV
ncbi:MAG: membrane protein insertion efficiency factor YidD [Defluviitoga tunisiensis]|jgi:putative membrane protein insertion efficiency factor|uniref:Putative membrane protein insertion efficiency factor n=1 Tax=Defluviitoga tunisiensis TaxID=1006576 RepID=A0A0C7NPY3_DEFTU|nr:membrane protein insertion efficiency factor YidD [Defluviitoga tunisiensis]MDD3600285.1 membrane protein insertion efficiency factor YidD [Defluviitoga tunisiensis]MDY0378889.1 membrane protein insertion efficiency factor YidD [Defluviitoga tunisiensis]CEP77962.1 hypothetical protein DTL3_0651 [Defluviitoga tunisiensis]HHV00738.1 membrane protein insertion efficiency factor YidD [Defluviitoga tunisiensis]HOB54966.1 membrane protein insertion efficiency factor YidD [Defluviitoga tunisiensis